jgi:hypothetical protein
MRLATAISVLSLTFLLARGHAQTSPFTVNGVVTNQISTPVTAPAVQVVCSGTTASYTYEYEALDASGGTTPPSPASTAVLGCATLSSSNFNIVTVPAISGAASCVVYRTAPSAVKVGSVACAGASGSIVDNSAGTAANAPSVNSTGGVNSVGTVTGQNFVATGGGAGTSDWVQGSALSLCSASQPQPCIQANSFFLQAPTGPIVNSFGWTAPSTYSTANAPLIVGQSTTSGAYTSVLSYGTLTDASSLNPVIATANGSSFTNGHLVSVSTSSGVDLTDSGIAVVTVSSPTDSLAVQPGTASTPTVTIGVTGSDSVINLSHVTKSTGAHSFQPGGDSTQMFQLKNAAGAIFASFDSSGKQFRIGDNIAPAAVLDVEGGFQVNGSGTPIKEGASSLVGAGLPGIVYNTVSGSATSGSISAATMVTAPTTNPENCGGTSNASCYRISFYAFQVGVGNTCSTNTAIEMQVIFQDPSASASSTVTVGAVSIAGVGNANSPISPSTGGSGAGIAIGATGGYTLRAKLGTAVQYKTNVIAGTCTTAPTYWVIPFLEQI